MTIEILTKPCGLKITKKDLESKLCQDLNLWESEADQMAVIELIENALRDGYFTWFGFPSECQIDDIQFEEDYIDVYII